MNYLEETGLIRLIENIVCADESRFRALLESSDLTAQEKTVFCGWMDVLPSESDGTLAEHLRFLVNFSSVYTELYRLREKKIRTGELK